MINEIQEKQFKEGWKAQGNKNYTICGTGSLIESCQNWINIINTCIEKYNIKKINDIGCGDLNYIKNTNIIKTNIDYLGFDYIPRNIYEDNVFKIYSDTFNISVEIPRFSDLCICKDVLNHLDQITQVIPAIENLKKTSKFLLLTNYNINNNDLSENYTGEWKEINFNISPYNLEPYLIQTIDFKHINGGNLYISLYKF